MEWQSRGVADKEVRLQKPAMATDATLSIIYLQQRSVRKKTAMTRTTLSSHSPINTTASSTTVLTIAISTHRQFHNNTTHHQFHNTTTNRQFLNSTNTTSPPLPLTLTYTIPIPYKTRQVPYHTGTMTYQIGSSVPLSYQ